VREAALQHAYLFLQHSTAYTDMIKLLNTTLLSMKPTDWLVVEGLKWTSVDQGLLPAYLELVVRSLGDKYTETSLQEELPG
jgi:hypothetical protein